MDAKNIARMIDISTVKAEATIEELNRMAAVAKEFKFICAFAMPCFTKRLVGLLSDDKDIKVGGVVGFPSGADTTSIKIATAKEMMAAGVDELDMVINVGALKSGLYEEVYNDIHSVVETADGMPVKCILEIAHLTDDEIKRGASIAVRAGVTYVKTGTGWAHKPTTVDTIKLIKSEIGDSALIKAAGGVRDLDTLLAMHKEGASRFGIGINSALSIMKEAYARENLPWKYEV
ncbi:MAG: deoxyribose-phosphate aldolase [Clostridia bacterium]|nr:deoxyribose-phosphate aldolase [Clostridia bacterium]